ncbi:hypothetical protein WN55_01738 [Dufourea novaeangliae]|uniref:Uncharacterized protein n=1 Tax=Dufourea novaeangliae TaxID=178035 RepID=A0A154PI95_DUFNO|nr:hypothetical protein WN55_01738 [Dufourea novaeangliae]
MCMYIYQHDAFVTRDHFSISANGKLGEVDRERKKGEVPRGIGNIDDVARLEGSRTSRWNENGYRRMCVDKHAYANTCGFKNDLVQRWGWGCKRLQSTRTNH